MGTSLWKKYITGLIFVYLHNSSIAANAPISAIYQGIHIFLSSSVPDKLTVIAEGSDTTKEGAIQKALLVAVQKSVGVLVISDLTIQNQQIITDKLLNYSVGFVKEYKEIECLENNGFRCKIIATVSPWNLRKKIESNKDKDFYINGSTLITEHDSKSNFIRQRNKLIEYYFKRIPFEGFTGKINATEIIPSNSENVKLRISYTVSWNKDFRNEFLNFLRQLEDDLDPTYIQGGQFYSPTVFIVPGLSGKFWRVKLLVETYDENIVSEMHKILSSPIEVTIQPFGRCVAFDSNTFSGMRKNNFFNEELVRTSEFVVNKIFLQKIEKIFIDSGCKNNQDEK